MLNVYTHVYIFSRLLNLCMYSSVDQKEIVHCTVINQTRVFTHTHTHTHTLYCLYLSLSLYIACITYGASGIMVELLGRTWDSF